MELIPLLVILIVLLFSSAYFSASETALFSLPSTKLKTYQASKDRTKNLIASLLSRPQELLVTVFMLNTLVNILLQNVISAMFGESASWILKVGVPLVLMLFLGEIIPKYIGIRINNTLSTLVAPSIDFFHRILKPIRRFVVAATAPVSRLMFFYLKPEQEITKHELKHVLHTSQKHGVLQQDEAELIWGYINLQDATVKEHMRPREDILFYNSEEPLSKLIHLFTDLQCARIPVYEETSDAILGIISARQFFLHQHAIKTSADLKHYLAKPLYVPETTLASSLLRRFEENKQVIALVIDEYGSLTGLISREDLFEVVVGDIADVRDTKTPYTKAGAKEIIASGRMELTEFNNYFNTDLQSETNMVILGGWLVERFGDIPHTGTQYEAEGFLFQILASDPNRVRRVYVRKL